MSQTLVLMLTLIFFHLLVNVLIDELRGVVRNPSSVIQKMDCITGLDYENIPRWVLWVHAFIAWCTVVGLIL